MRRALLTAVVLVAAASAASTAFAQDGPRPPQPQQPASQQAWADEISAAYDADSQEEDRAQEINAHLVERRKGYEKTLADLERGLADLRQSYSGDDDAPSPPELDEVADRIASLEAALAEDRDPEVVAARRDERRDIDVALHAAHERARALPARYRAWHAKVLGSTQGAAQEQALSTLADMEKNHEAMLESIVQSYTDARAELDRCRTLRGMIDDRRSDSLGVLRRENLFLRGETDISLAAISAGVRDISALPAWLAAAAAAVWHYLSDPEMLPEIGRFALVALALVAGLLFLRSRVRRRFREPATMTQDSERVLDLSVRTLSSALFAAAIAVTPLIAARTLPSLPPAVSDLLRVLGLALAGFWFLRATTRRLLPREGAWSPIDLEPRCVTLMRTGVAILLWTSVIVLPVATALHRLGYRNVGALAAFWTLYKLFVVVILVTFVFREPVLLGLLPKGSGRFSGLRHAIVAVLRPLLVLVGPLILALDFLQYDLLAEFLVRVVGGVLVAAVLAFFVYGAVWRGLSAWLPLVVAPGDEVSGDRRAAALAIARYALRVAVLVGALWVLLVAQGGDLDSLRNFLGSDLPFQAKEGPHVSWWDVTSGLALLVLFLSAVPKAKLLLERFVLPRATHDASVRYTIATLAGYSLAALGIYIALLQVFDLSALGYVFAALSVGIGFGLQEIVSNFVSGLILLFERPLKVGDLVTVGGTEGWVTKISIRATTIQTRDNVSMLIPNKDFITQAVVNSDYGDPVIRMRVRVGVAYGSDTALVERLLVEAGRAHPRVLSERSTEALFLGFGESSLDFELRCWIPDGGAQPKIASDLRFAIDKAFRENGVAIPFPQRDLHLRSVDDLAASRLRDGRAERPEDEPPAAERPGAGPEDEPDSRAEEGQAR